MAEKTWYTPGNDPYYAEPYIDEEGWKERPEKYYYVHGGFKGTERNGAEVRFCLYFPEKEKYEGRFFQYFSPAPEDEHESENLTGEEDRIRFALTHGAYFVVSNQGGFQMDDPERLFKANSNTAEFSRQIARKLYGDHRPYGYCFGGSGGSFKTMGAMESTEGVWDGAVPYVMANPMAAPNNFAPRVRVMRVLGEEGIRKVMAAVAPGGSGDIYEGLTPEQQEVLREATRMGFPVRAWFAYDTMGDGALMVLAPYIYGVYPQYFQDFWTKEGFVGADPGSSEARARVQFRTKVTELVEPPKPEGEGEVYNNVDNSWINVLTGSEAPAIRTEALPPEGSYLYHCRVRFLTGEAAGNELPLDTIEDGLIKVSAAMINGGPEMMKGLKVGDEILIDNSDYLAMQTLQRYQVPDESFVVYDQYRNEDGSPKYPQLPFMLAPIVALNGAGCNLTGDFRGKMIGLCNLLDESAFPWHGDWYRKKAAAALAERGIAESDAFRLYYSDNCLHGDAVHGLAHPDYEIDYVGILHQALLDVAAWVEKGIEPVRTSTYEIVDGQMKVPGKAHDRSGIQPTVDALANGEKFVTVKAGEPVKFTAEIENAAGTGRAAYAAWEFEGGHDWNKGETLVCHEGAEGSAVVTAETEHVFEWPGTYYPVIKVYSTRDGSTEDIFIRCKNMDKVRVDVI